MGSSQDLEGAVSFKKSIYGWRVSAVWPTKDTKRRDIQLIKYRNDTVLTVIGKFRSSLRAGHFCKRPHQLVMIGA